MGPPRLQPILQCFKPSKPNSMLQFFVSKSPLKSIKHQHHFTHKLESASQNMAVFTSSTKTSAASFPPLMPLAPQQSLSHSEHSARNLLPATSLSAIVGGCCCCCCCRCVWLLAVVGCCCCWLLAAFGTLIFRCFSRLHTSC